MFYMLEISLLLTSNVYIGILLKHILVLLEFQQFNVLHFFGLYASESYIYTY